MSFFLGKTKKCNSISLSSEEKLLFSSSSSSPLNKLSTSFPSLNLLEDSGKITSTSASGPCNFSLSKNPVEILDNFEIAIGNNKTTHQSVVSGEDDEDEHMEDLEVAKSTCTTSQQNNDKYFPRENISSTLSTFDDNGNIMEEEEANERGILEEEIKMDSIENEEEPKYFINAAALSEDEEYIFIDQKEFQQQKNNVELLKSKHEEDENKIKSSENKSKIKIFEKSCIPHRSRVPISKSFPDIVQTTLNDDGNNSISTKENSDFEDVLIVDSLEDLTSIQTQSENNDERDNSKASTSSTTITTTDSSSVRMGQIKPKRESQIPRLFERSFDHMTTSTMSSQSGVGILDQKPPEAWVIDFNSLSMESSMFDSRGRGGSNSGSNPNSMAFFVNIDENLSGCSGSEMETSKTSLSERRLQSPKKIFSMFVDINNEMESKDKKRNAQNSTPPPSQLVHNKTIRNLSGCDSERSKKRHASPIFQHKAATDAARQIALQKISNENESGGGGGGGGGGNKRTDRESGIQQDLNSASNRSSLHLPNMTELEHSMFSSGLLSSMEISIPEESSLCQKGPCLKLGKDLLRIYQDGINTDLTIRVNGSKVIKCHKCILSSRSQYFAAILSGNFVERAGNTINLDGFSYNVVNFTMSHIYSGTNDIPEEIDLLELANLTDLLGLEGLRENISQTIRVNYCHNFHRPCTICISGVLECYPIALAYGMDELQRKMTKWISKFFVRIWPTKAFANLGEAFMDKCLRYTTNHLSPENILDIVLGCDQLVSTMPSIRWTEPIFKIVNALQDACVLYIGDNFSKVIQSQRFLLFGRGQIWNIGRIEKSIMDSLLLLKPDEACCSHTALSRLIELGTEAIDEVCFSTIFVDFVKVLRKEIECYLIANASRAVLSSNWESLSQDCRKRICASSFLGIDKKSGNKTAAEKKKSNNSSANDKRKNSSTSVSIKNSHTNLSQISTQKSPSSPTSSTIVINSNNSNVANNSKTTNNKSISSSSNSSTSVATKVASVRPMQNVYSTSNTSTNNKTAATLSRAPQIPKSPLPQTRQRVSSLSKHTKSTSLDQSQRDKERDINKNPSNLIQREKEREKRSYSPRNLSRTPLKPLTPMTPSKNLPGLIGTSSNNLRRSRQIAAAAAAVEKEKEKQQMAIKPQFLTNSEKAKLVSRPSTASSSSAAAAGSGSRFVNLSTNNTSNRPGSGTFGRRTGEGSRGGSFSNSERPERISAVKKEASNNAINKKGLSIAPGRRGNHGSQSASSSSSRSSQANKDKHGAYMDNSYHDIMSKSSIDPFESSNTEAKQRTLAEIGRSNTFCKDEPEILGKLPDTDIPLTLDPIINYNSDFL